MKRLWILFAFFAMFSLGMCLCSMQVYASGTNDPETLKEAQQIPYKACCDQLPGKNMREISDNNANSCINVNDSTPLEFTTDSPVSGIYCIFQYPCKWTVKLPDGTAINGGQNGFMHEYMAFNTNVTEFEMCFEGKVQLSEIYAFTDGKLPDWVQIWEPPCQKADLLVLPTHADDEFLWFGGALPYYAGELGYNVQVVYLVNHQNQTYRRHELLNGLWRVGVKHYPVISSPFMDKKPAGKTYADATAAYGFNHMLEYQVKILRRFAPKVVLGHDVYGEYGHGAHMLNARTLLEALPLTSDPDSFPDSAAEYGTCTVGKCYIHLWRKNTIQIEWSSLVLSHFGGKSAFEMAKDGYACHKSQGNVHKLLEEGNYDCRKFGLAYTTVGYDTPETNDMFEHIDMSQYIQNNKDDDIIKNDKEAVPNTDQTVNDKSSQKTNDKVAVNMYTIIAVAFVLTVVTALAVLLTWGNRKTRRRLNE